MQRRLSRRYFMSASLTTAAVTATVGLPSLLSKLLGRGAVQTDHVARVLAILMQEFRLTEAHSALAGVFTASLLNGQHHSLSGADFAELLQAKPGQGKTGESLESYVSVQFVLSTNYLEFAHGSASELHMLKSFKGRDQSIA